MSTNSDPMVKCPICGFLYYHYTNIVCPRCNFDKQDISQNESLYAITATIAQKDAEIERLREAHPRAFKLMKKEKFFLVVAIDEPYFINVYDTIRAHEKAKGTWTKKDEIAWFELTRDGAI